MRRGGESDQRVECDKSLVDQLVVVDSGWKQGCGLLVPQHTGCKQRSCSGRRRRRAPTPPRRRRAGGGGTSTGRRGGGGEKKKGSGRMPGGPTTSLVCFAIHLGLFSASFGAAVDAPNTATESVALVKGGEVTEEVAESRGRFPRSVSDYQDSLDYPNKLSAYGAEDSGSRSRRRFSESEWKSDGDGEWELAAQVAKRGQRGRGEYYRGPAEEEVTSVIVIILILDHHCIVFATGGEVYELSLKRG